MAHHVGPVLDEAHVLVAAGRERRGRRRRRSAPRAAARGAPRPTCGRAASAARRPPRRPSPVVDDARRERRLRLRLALAAHRAVHELGPSLADQHRGGQRVRGALAGRQAVGVRGIEREEAAAVLQQHAGVAGHDARAPLLVDALDDRGRVAVGVDRAAERRVARGARDGERGRGRAGAAEQRGALGEVRRVEQAVERDVAEGRVAEVAVAVLERERASRARRRRRSPRGRRRARRRRRARASRGSAGRRSPASSAAARRRRGRGSRTRAGSTQSRAVRGEVVGGEDAAVRAPGTPPIAAAISPS